MGLSAFVHSEGDKNLSALSRVLLTSLSVPVMCQSSPNVFVLRAPRASSASNLPFKVVKSVVVPLNGQSDALDVHGASGSIPIVLVSYFHSSISIRFS